MQNKMNAPSEIGYSSISKLRQILDCFSFYKPSLTVHQIAKQVDIPVSSLYRYLQAMVNAKLLSHDRISNTYSIGTYIIELAGISLIQYDIRFAALPELNHLSNALNLNANLSVLDGCDIFHIGFSIKYFATPWVDAIGRRTPAYQTAMGRAMLAFHPFEKVKNLIEEACRNDPDFYPLPDFEELRRDFEIVRETQLVTLRNHSPISESICASSPIRRRGNEVCAAISVNWYKDYNSQSFEELYSPLTRALLNSAARISYKLGYVGRAYDSTL